MLSVSIPYDSMIEVTMTALIVKKLLITYGLMLVIAPPPQGSHSNTKAQVQAFSINPNLPKHSKISVNPSLTEQIPLVNAASKFPPSDSKLRSIGSIEACERPRKNLPEKAKSKKVLDSIPLRLPITKEASASVGIPVLAKAALATYDPEHSFENENYHICNYLDFDGFRAATYCNPDEKVAIIAFRGTQNTKDAAFDLALFYGQEQVLGSLAKLFSGLGYTQDGLLEILTSFGNDLVATTNKNYSIKVKQAHKSYLEKLTKRWQTYRHQHLSPHSVAEKTLNERVGYVSDYTKKQVKHFKSLGYDIFLTGHSLGGLYAQLASMMFSLPGATFNAPGISDVLYHCENFTPQTLQGRNFINYRHNDDLVSLFRLDDHFGSVIAHESHKKDPYTAHNMASLAKLLNDAHFDEQGEYDYADLVSFINEEDEVLSARYY